jgi:excinuclease UvrABC nuclease subunit
MRRGVEESLRPSKTERRRDPSTSLRSARDDNRATRPIEAMIHEVADIKIIKTDSVLEAVILEGKYIKKFLPKYNVDWKDDKSWNYLVITNEKFPRLVAVREREINKISNFQFPNKFQIPKIKNQNRLQITDYKLRVTNIFLALFRP